MLRVCFLQPIVPLYRVPVFERLAAEPDIQLEVWAGTDQVDGSLEPAPPSDAFGFRRASIRRVGPLTLQPAQLRAALAGPFDVLVLPWRPRSPEFVATVLSARALGKRVVLWGQGTSKNETPQRTAIRDGLGRLGDALMFYAHHAARQAVGRGTPRDKVYVALNAIDQEPIRAARARWAGSEALAAFQQEHDVGPDRTVLFVSRLEPGKQVGLLLDAFGRVVAAKPDARLVLVGGGSQRDALRQQAEAMGIGDRVTMPGPIYDEDAIAPWFLSAGVFAYPVAIGLSILHAFGYGVPVVTSDDRAGHNPEFEALRPGANGRTYRDGDLDDLARVILDVLQDRDRHRQLSDEALRTAGPSGFTVDRMVAGMAAAIRGTAPPDLDAVVPPPLDGA